VRGVALEKMGGQGRDVVEALAQRGEPDLHGVEAIE